MDKFVHSLNRNQTNDTFCDQQSTYVVFFVSIEMGIEGCCFVQDVMKPKCLNPSKKMRYQMRTKKLGFVSHVAGWRM